MQIRDNKSPDLIKETLVSYLPEKQRDDLVREAAYGAGRADRWIGTGYGEEEKGTGSGRRP